ncbi:MAG: FAA hydrolase family protein, partial [Maricaulis sp.]|nr:FAA hydrolase family protein [Maricaulis sp.]
MKLASLKNGHRDGKLVVVSKDIAWYADASSIAPTMQAALDDWERCESELQSLYEQLNRETIP